MLSIFKTMSIQKIYEEQSDYNLSDSFKQTLTELKPKVEGMVSALANYKRLRMEVVGRLVEHRHMTENQDDKKAIQLMLKEFTSDVVDNCVAAYKSYKQLKGNVNPEFQRLAEEASPSQLKVIGRSTDTTLAYDAAMALKKTGKVPTVSKLRGHLGGYTDNKFNSSNHSHPNNPDTTLTPAKPEVKTAFELRGEAADRLIDDVNYRYIHDRDSAETYLASNTNATIAVCMEKISRLKTCDEKRVKQLKHLIQLAKAALELPAVYEHSYFK